PGSSAPRPGAIPAPSRSPTAAQLTTRTTELARGGKGAVCPQVEVTLSTTAHPPIERLGRGFPLVLAPPLSEIQASEDIIWLLRRLGPITAVKPWGIVLAG